MILLLFRVVRVVLTLSENDMRKKTDLQLKNTLLIGKHTAEVQDQDVINKWQRFATVSFVFGRKKQRYKVDD